MGLDFFRPDLLIPSRREALDRKSYLLIGLAILYQLCFVFQGLDVADAGFHLTAYQRIFSDPESVHYSFMFWLSSVLGGGLMALFPSGGLLYFRLLGVLLFCFNFYLLFRLLRTLMPAKRVVVYLFLSFLFVHNYGASSLHYDAFTVTFFLGAVSCFYFGLPQVEGLARQSLRGANTRLLALGCLLLGLSTYLRITNLAALAFPGLILLLTYRWGVRGPEMRRILFALAGGYAIGHSISLGLMLSLGHFDLFLENLLLVRGMAGDADSSHGALPLLLQYGRGWGIATVFGGLVLAGMVGWQRMLREANSNPGAIIEAENAQSSPGTAGNSERPLNTTALLRIPVLFSLLFTALFLAYLFIAPNSAWSKIRYVYYGLFLFSGLVALRLRDSRWQSLTLLGLALCIVFPLGSDSGIEKVYYVAGLSGAVIIAWFDRAIVLPGWKQVKYALLIVFVIVCVMHAWHNTYFDPGTRLAKIHQVEHPDLRGVYTTEARARLFTELLDELESQGASEREMLAFSDLPLVHYLSGARPYVRTSWPKLFYSPAWFRAELARARTRTDELPLIVMHRMDVRFSWTEAPVENYLVAAEYLHRYADLLVVLERFMEAHAYRASWQNDGFVVYRASSE